MSESCSAPMRDWIVIPGPASSGLGKGLAAALNVPLATAEIRVFPDGESKIRFAAEVRNRAVILVQSTYPPVDRHLMQAFFMAHKLSEDGAEVFAAIPYLGYARQDKEFLPGEVVSLGVVVRLLRSVGVKRLVTVDLPSVEGLGHFSFPAYSVSATPFLAEYVRTHFDLQQPFAASPDFGARARVEAFAKVLGCEYRALRKRRDRHTGEVQVEPEALQLGGRDALIVDDIISTGGSVVKAAELLLKHGARRVLVTCTHPLLLDDAAERIRAAGVEAVIGTNSVPSPVSLVDIVPALAAHFKSLIQIAESA